VLGYLSFTETSLFGLSITALLAFAGSVLTMVVIYSLARSGGRTNVVTLLLAGFAVSTILANCTYIFEVLDTASGSGTRILLSWLRGVISTPHWSELTVAAAALSFGLIMAAPLTRRLNTLALGDEYAHQLGLNIEHTRMAIILIGSLLTSVAVALGGLISFAGLIIPNMSRLLLGPDNTRLLPVSVLAGAIFLVLADTLARTILAPTEIPVGILMALLGGPFFLYLLRRPRRELSL
jgi:iron complex transport system permease protein